MMSWIRDVVAGQIPWVLPGVLAALGIWRLTGRRLARVLRVHPTVTFLMIVGFGVVASVTLTPLRDAIEVGYTGTGVCDLSRVWPLSPRLWWRISDETMNIAMFVPIGLSIGLVPRSFAKAVLVTGAVLLPFAIEWVQLVATVLARGCEAADVVDNLTGLLVGLTMATVVTRVAVRVQARPVGADQGRLPNADRPTSDVTA